MQQEGELSPGDLCDDYRVVSLIAAGGMGDVYEAVHQITGKTVAVKCLKVRHRNKEDARARMKMEAVVLAELQHANLVQVYDAGVTESGMVWIAMERLHGQTLRELMYRSGPLPVADALFYAGEIADGVDAVHDVNVIHRDLKPENVFVTVRNVVKVLDLGTGKFTGYGLNSTDRMRIVGTTAYMSPEQIKGLRVDARADVYALGLIVYEMLSGRHALAGADGLDGLPDELERLALMQLQMVPKPLSELTHGLPVYVSTIVARAMAKNRDERFPAMNDFARDLRAARKRFIAENRLDDAPAELLAKIVGLREKLGAPPRASSSPPGRFATPGLGAKAARSPLDERKTTIEGKGNDRVKTEMDLDPPFHTELDVLGDQGSLRTEMQTRPPGLTMSGETPVPASYQPTVELSQYSMPPGMFEAPRSGRVPPNDIRMHTTNTSPLGVEAADETLEPISVPEGRERVRRGMQASRVLRRVGVTLGLGALIGVPPALVGVMWTVHHTHARAAAVSAPSTASTETTAVGVMPPGEPPTAPSTVPEEVQAARSAEVAAGLAATAPSVSAMAPTEAPGPAQEKHALMPVRRGAPAARVSAAGPLVTPDWSAAARVPAAVPKPVLGNDNIARGASATGVAQSAPQKPAARMTLPGSGL